MKPVQCMLGGMVLAVAFAIMSLFSGGAAIEASPPAAVPAPVFVPATPVFSSPPAGLPAPVFTAPPEYNPNPRPGCGLTYYYTVLECPEPKPPVIEAGFEVAVLPQA